MKHNYKEARRIYSSLYTSITEQFKIYVNFLPPDEIGEIENDFRSNGNDLLFVRDTESATKLFNSFTMFCYINGKLPYTDGHLYNPYRDIPLGIQDTKLSLIELFTKIFRTKSNGLVSAPFLAALLLFFVGKVILVKNFHTELYRNLTVEVRSPDNNLVLEFQTFTDLCDEINVRLAYSIFTNHERARLDMKRKLKTSAKNVFFYDNDENDDKNFLDDVSVNQESDNEIHERDTSHYMSPGRESDNEIDEKIYKEPKIETTVEIGNQAIID